MYGTADRLMVITSFAALYLLWGGTYLAIALGLQSIPPFLLMGFRSVLAGAILLVVSNFWGLRKRASADWLHATISGFLFFVGCHGALAYAQRFVPSGLSAVVLATIPFWIVLVNAAIGIREPMWKFMGLIPGFLGVAVIAWHERSASERALSLAMIALLLVSALAWALGSVYSQRRAAHIPSYDLAGMQLLCGGVGLLVLSIVGGEWTNFDLQNVSGASITGVLYLVLLGSVIGNTAYLWLLDRISAPVVATYTFVNPVIALILGWWVLDERVTLPSLIGAALVIGSIIAVLCASEPAPDPKMQSR